jgi:hypothetical protein
VSQGDPADGRSVVWLQFPVTALAHRPLLIKYIVDGRFKVCCRPPSSGIILLLRLSSRSRHTALHLAGRMPDGARAALAREEAKAVPVDPTWQQVHTQAYGWERGGGEGH